jgi:hypothetical protein
MAKRDNYKLESPVIRLHSDGLELGSSFLWLDSFSLGKISFISSAVKKNKITCPKIITTQEVASTLALAKEQSHHLICPLNQPFSLGVLTIELLPSGYMLGSSSLLINMKGLRVLYAPNIQTSKLAQTRGLQIKQADIFITNSVYANQPSNFSRKNEKVKLLGYLETKIKEQRFPIIFCPQSPSIAEISKLILEKGMRLCVHKKAHEINKIYNISSNTYSNYSLLDHKKNIAQDVVLFPFDNNSHKEFYSCIGRDEVYIHNSLTEMDSFEKRANFLFPDTCDLTDLSLAVKESRAKKVYIYGPWAEKAKRKLEALSIDVSILYCENQQPLL